MTGVIKFQTLRKSCLMQGYRKTGNCIFIVAIYIEKYVTGFHENKFSTFKEIKAHHTYNFLEPHPNLKKQDVTMRNLRN